MKRPVVLFAALCGAVLLTGSACSSGDAPGPNFSSVSTTASPSTTDTPTESPSPASTENIPSGAISPTMPVAAARDDSDGAFAFVAYYWMQVDWAYSTVDGDVLDGLFRATCKSCASSQSAINEVKGGGNSFRGGHLTIKSQSLAAASSDSTADFAVDTVLDVEALSEVTSTGTEVKAYPASSYTVRAFVAWVDDHFEVTATANVGGS